MRIPLAFCLLFTAAALAACGTSEPLMVSTADAVGFTVITDSLPDDPEIEAMIAPYREQMGERVQEVIGTVAVEMTEGRPEGTLGNFAADAMLQEVQEHTNRPVQMALTNNGGLRTTVGPGDITVGRMYELMPFDNSLVILDFSAAQVDSLAQQLARSGGGPIAGFTFVIDATTRTAREILVAGEPLDSERTYRLVTIDYLANGGGDLRALWLPVPREELPVYLRDAFIEYVRSTGVIEARLDGRIRLIDESN